MDKLKKLTASRAFWATAGVIAATAFGAAGSAITGAMQTIACTLQVCS